VNPAINIAAFLASDSATNTQASGAAGKTYWPVAPADKPLPYVCVRLAATRRINPAIDRTGALLECQVEILIFAESQSVAWEIADAVTSDLDNKRGDTAGIRLQKCVITNALDIISEDLFAKGIFSVELTATVIV
jgi:hypothetical protein